VLKGASEEDGATLCKEYSWDLREELAMKGWLDAVCEVSWSGETGKWDKSRLDKLLKECRIANKNLHPTLWKRAKDFIKRNNIPKSEEDVLWSLFQKHDIPEGDQRKEI